jgi:hypothetical protein
MVPRNDATRSSQSLDGFGIECLEVESRIVGAEFDLIRTATNPARMEMISGTKIWVEACIMSSDF